MAKNRFKCLTGWLLAPSPTDGKTDVPFFVQVRGKDIHNKKEDVFDPDLLERIGDAEVTECYGECYLKMNVGKWQVKVFNNGLYEAKMRLSFSDEDLILSEDKTVLSEKIELPFITDITDDIFTNTSVNSTDDSLASTLISTSFTDPYREYYKTINIKIRNIFDKFSDNYKKDEVYEKSTAFITVTGKVCIDVHFVG